MRVMSLLAPVLILGCLGLAFNGPDTLNSSFSIPTNLAVQDLASDATPDVKAKIQSLNSSNPRERAEAACALKGDDRAVAPLTIALHAEGAEVRSQAAWALGLKGDTRAVEPLIAALKDPDSDVRSQAAWALGLKGDERAIEPLKVALNDADEQVRKQAAWALQLRGLKSGHGLKLEAPEINVNLEPKVKVKVKSK